MNEKEYLKAKGWTQEDIDRLSDLLYDQMAYLEEYEPAATNTIRHIHDVALGLPDGLDDEDNGE